MSPENDHLVAAVKACIEAFDLLRDWDVADLRREGSQTERTKRRIRAFSAAKRARQKMISLLPMESNHAK